MHIDYVYRVRNKILCIICKYNKIMIFIIIIVEKDRQWKAERDRFTPYQSEKNPQCPHNANHVERKTRNE